MAFNVKTTTTTTVGHFDGFENVFSKIALLHLTSDDDVPMFHAAPS